MMHKKDQHTIKDVMSNYKRYKKIRKKVARVYYRRLFRASVFLSIVPFILIAILVIYGRLTFIEGILSSVAVLYGSTFFAKPYLTDLSSLTNYVESLALDKKTTHPPLSFLGNVEELSESVKNLHETWEHRKVQLEAALTESRILFDTLPDILLMLDDKLNIVRANHAASSKLKRNIIGQNLKNIVKDQAFIKKINKVISKKEGENTEISLSRYNVNYDYNVWIENFPIYSHDGIALVVIMHDVTESKKTRQMIKDFVANASHEIRTPLTSIIGFIETLQDMEGKDPDAAKHFLGIMSEQSQRMVNLVNDLLSLSKIEINETQPLSDSVDIVPIIESTNRRLSLLAQKSKMNLVLKNNAKETVILGDANEITQVFTNIIGNAIKYGKLKTDIEITIFNKNKSDAEDQKGLFISVKDYGEGIDQENIPRLTERFYRVDKQRSRKVGGTGLGLSIVRHILNRHKGILDIKSTIGKGSTFTVELPLIEESKQKS
ncbi:ATP-binding protein [Rickettsiales bacterium]|nr:ATP-binding protein [Rickettsiales bacterium]